jgi:hypothetical protein
MAITTGYTLTGVNSALATLSTRSGQSAPTAAKTAKTETDASSDTVTLSEEAKTLAAKKATAAKASSSGGSGDSEKTQLSTLQDRVKKIQQELDALAKSDLPEKTKQVKRMALSQELMLLTRELAKLQGGSSVPSGGTPAKGFASSLT